MLLSFFTRGSTILFLQFLFALDTTSLLLENGCKVQFFLRDKSVVVRAHNFKVVQEVCDVNVQNSDSLFF